MTSSDGNALLDSLKTVIVAILKFCGMMVGWIFKLLGLLLAKISSSLFKLSKK